MDSMILAKQVRAGASIFVTLVAVARAQTAAPLLEPKPAFVPGLYETESRNSAFKDQGIKSKTCFASTDFDTFRDETMAQYQKAPQFSNGCQLSDTNRFRTVLPSPCNAGAAKRFSAFVSQRHGEQHH